MDLSTSASSPFVCPGSTQAVTRAVHLARLNAAWPQCDDCEWRMHSEGLADRTVQETEHIRRLRTDGIRRTEFGIRGQYINELDRRTSADLARVFCACFREQSGLHHANSAGSTSVPGLSIFPPVTERNSVSPEPNMIAPAALIAGYDNRSSSPDIFVGLVSSIREFGIPVIDVGRCTAASIQEATRSFSDSAGAILVTGSGHPASWTGLDVFDRHGDPLPVIWKDFGIRLVHVSTDANDNPVPPDNSEPKVAGRDDRIAELLLRLRNQDTSLIPTDARPSSGSILRLQLPEPAQRTSWSRRLTRHSGAHQVEAFEERYRHWLRRWFPERSTTRILVRSDDPLIRQRTAWLSEETGLEVVSRSKHDDNAVPSCSFTMTIDEDDRVFSVKDGAGNRISSFDIATQLNHAVRSCASQVTAHADPVSERFWLTDAGRRNTGTVEHIRDSLAVLGILVGLVDRGQLTLSGTH